MGLHNRTRDYLYKSFVKKNYQGLSQKEINNLLVINPDDFLNYQENKVKYENFFSEYENLILQIDFSNKIESNIDIIYKIFSKYYSGEYFIYLEHDELSGKNKEIFKKGFKKKINLETLTKTSKNIIIDAYKKNSYSELLSQSSLLVKSIEDSLLFPVVASGKIYGFVIISVKNLVINQDNSLFIFLKNILLILANQYKNAIRYNGLKEQKNKKEIALKLYSKLMDKFLLGIKPGQSEILEFFKEQHIKGCMLLRKSAKSAAFLVYVGYTDIPDRHKFDIKSSLPVDNFIKESELDYYTDMLAQNKLVASNIYVYKMKDMKDIYLFLPDLPSSLIADKELLRGFCRYLTILLYNFQGGELGGIKDNKKDNKK